MSNNSWMTALREWNQKHNTRGSWCIPKKGTTEYDKVRQMMTPSTAAPKPPRVKRQVSQASAAPAPGQGYWVRGEDGKRKWVKAGSGIKEV